MTLGINVNAEPANLICNQSWTAEGLRYTADRPLQVFLVQASDSFDELTYDPHRGGQLFGAWAHGVAGAIAARQMTSGENDHLNPTISVDGHFVLCRIECIKGPRGDLRSTILSIPLEHGARTCALLDCVAGLAASGFTVVGDSELALLASDSGADGLGMVAPDAGERL